MTTRMMITEGLSLTTVTGRMSTGGRCPEAGRAPSPRPLVYSPAHTQCVEPALAPAECAAWQQLKCAAECPRVLLTSTGPASLR